MKRAGWVIAVAALVALCSLAVGRSPMVRTSSESPRLIAATATEVGRAPVHPTAPRLAALAASVAALAIVWLLTAVPGRPTARRRAVVTLPVRSRAPPR
jgi:hypothetical protein